MRSFTLSILIVCLFQVQIIFSAPPLLEYNQEFPHNSGKIIKNIDPRVKLPETVKPTLYDLEIRPILDEGYGTQFTAPAKITIRIECLANTNSITLHALGLTINNTSIRISEEGNNDAIAITSFGSDVEKDFFIMNLASELETAKFYMIYIEYAAPIHTDRTDGLYRSSYKATDGNIINLSITDFEPADARRVFPCFDEPQLKASWKMSIIRLTKYHSLANERPVTTGEDVPELPDWVKDTYQETPPMSTYLVCFSVSDFLSAAAAEELYESPVVVWGPPPLMERGGGTYSPDISAKLLKFLEDYFGIHANLTKMDKISIPDYPSGAMENWGLNTYREARLLYIEGLTTIQDKVSMTNTISHELVHQWFGNLVTMRWWDDLWLNEGFASFYSNVAVHGIGILDFAPMESLVTGSVQNAFQADTLPTTHPIHHEVNTPAEIRSIFDTITYSKGSALVRMMDNFLSESVMKEGMKLFLIKYTYDNAHQDDLFAEMQTVGAAAGRLPEGRTFKQIMDTWTTQSGFPYVKVTRNSDGSAFFQQDKFVLDYSGNPVDDGEQWDIPLTYRVQGSDSISSVWMTEENLTVSNLGTEDEWIIVNPEQKGYYRVQYESRNLAALIDQLLADHTAIDELTRSSLIDDNLNLAFGGMIDLNEALRLTTYLKNERNLIPWVSFVTNMAVPYRMFGRSSTFIPFKKYISGLMIDALEAIQIAPQPDEPVANATLLRNRLFEWTCNVGYQPCITYAKEKFANWTQNPEDTSSILPDLQPSVYCTAIANGGDAEWNFALEQYRVSERDPAKVNLIRALGCAKSSFRLARLLDLALDLNSGLAAAHRVTALQAVAGNSAGAELTFNFIRNNFQLLIRRYGASIFSSTITTLSNYFNDRFDVVDLEGFINTNSAALAPVRGSLDTSIYNINKNMRWMDRNSPTFRAFLLALP